MDGIIDILKCPICHEILISNISMTSDGFSYHKQCIHKWLDNHLKSPVTNLPISKETYEPLQLIQINMILLKLDIFDEYIKNLPMFIISNEKQYVIDKFISLNNSNDIIESNNPGYNELFKFFCEIGDEKNASDMIAKYKINCDFDILVSIVDNCMCELFNNPIIENILSILTPLERCKILMRACIQGASTIALKIMKYEIDYNYKDENGTTSLMWACSRRLETVALEILDKQNIDVCHVCNIGESALIISCAAGMNNVALKIIDHILKINRTECLNIVYNNTNPLILACKNVLEEVVNKLLDCEGVYCGNIDNVSPLRITCARKMTNCSLKLLKRKDVDINHKGKFGITALMNACGNNENQIIFQLLDRKNIDINITSRSGNTALILSCRNSNIGVALRLLEMDNINYNQSAKNANNALYWAIKNNLTIVFEKLLKKNDIRISSTIIHAIIDNISSNGENKTLLDILKYINFPCYSDKNKRSHIFLRLCNSKFICEKYSYIITEMLDTYDLNFGYADNSSLICLCRNKMGDIALKLLNKYDSQANSDEKKIYNSVNSNNSSCLAAACKYNLSNVAMKLLDYEDIECNHLDRYKNNAFMWAIVNKMYDVSIKMMGRNDIEYGIYNIRGSSPLNIAYYHGAEDIIIKLLEKYQSDNIFQYLNSEIILSISTKMQSVENASLLSDMIDKNNFEWKNFNNKILLLVCSTGISWMALKILQKTDINCSEISDFCDTVLSLACKKNWTDVAMEILRRPDIDKIFNVINNEGKSAIDYALINNMDEVVNKMKFIISTNK